MQELFNNFATYSYIALFFYSLGGGFFGIVAATVLSSLGKMDLTISFVVATLSNYIGDMLLFYIARYNKSLIANQISKHRRKFALSNLLIKKYGNFAIFIQKFIYGVKTLVPIAFGLSKYSFFKFGIFNIFASVIFVGFITIISLFASEQIIAVAIFVKNYPWIYPIIIISIIIFIYFYFKFATKKRKN